MVLTITTAGIEACPGSSRGPTEKGVEMLSKGIKAELDSEVDRGKPHPSQSLAPREWVFDYDLQESS